MATVSPVISVVDKIPQLKWAALATGDTINRFTVTEQWGLAGCVQFAGTFGGATMGLQMSNDGANWVAVKDLQGNNISATSGAMFEFTCSAAYIRPSISGGTGDAVDAIIVMRGLY